MSDWTSISKNCNIHGWQKLALKWKNVTEQIRISKFVESHRTRNCLPLSDWKSSFPYILPLHALSTQNYKFNEWHYPINVNHDAWLRLTVMCKNWEKKMDWPRLKNQEPNKVYFYLTSESILVSYLKNSEV